MPADYLTYIVIPAQLHISPAEYTAMPPARRRQIEKMLYAYLRSGWGGKPETITRG